MTSTANTVLDRDDYGRWLSSCIAAGHPIWDDHGCWCGQPELRSSRWIPLPAEHRTHPGGAA